MKLPNGARAELGTKLDEYVLNPEHRRGRHKARVFAAVLGVTRENQHVLANALREAAANSDAAVATGNYGYGETFELRIALTTEQGTATIVSAWIVREGEDFPRLTTCFIL